MESLWLVPATVRVNCIDPSQSRLSVLFTNGQHVKFEASHDYVRELQTALLTAQANQEPVDVSQWAGFCFDGDVGALRARISVRGRQRRNLHRSRQQ